METSLIGKESSWNAPKQHAIEADERKKTDIKSDKKKIIWRQRACGTITVDGERDFEGGIRRNQKTKGHVLGRMRPQFSHSRKGRGFLIRVIT